MPYKDSDHDTVKDKHTHFEEEIIFLKDNFSTLELKKLTDQELEEKIENATK